MRGDSEAEIDDKSAGGGGRCGKVWNVSQVSILEEPEKDGTPGIETSHAGGAT